MELGEYFSKVFRKIFIGNIYWPTFVLTLIFSIVLGIIFAVITFAFAGGALYSLFSVLSTTSANALTTNPNSLLGVFAGLGVLLVLTIIFGLIMTYLFNVIYVFTIKRIQATESKTKRSLGFFEFFGQSFGPGFMLFLALLIYWVVMVLVMSIIAMVFGLIPVVGAILAIIIDTIILFYAMSGILVLSGEISVGKSFGTALSHAFSKQIHKPKIFWYTIILGLVSIIISFVANLLGFIPLLGIIILFFVWIGLFIYGATIAYYYTKE